MSLRQAAAYLGVSYWSVRDLALNGKLPLVRVPAARVDAGPRRGKRPPRRVLLEHDAPDLRGRSLRRVLLDRLDLDRLIETWKDGAA